MLKGSKHNTCLLYILISAILTVSVLPGFALLGNLLLQVSVTALVALIFILLTDKIFKPEPIVYARSLNYMTIFWIIFAVIKQIIFHITKNEFTFRWYQLFYFDRPALVFVVYFICMLYFISKLLIKKNDVGFTDKYSNFIKSATSGFLAYYGIILFYSFFLIRTITFERPEVNLKPFEMMIFTFTRGYIDYELFFLFLGNIAIFLPLGILVSAFSKKKILLITLPIIISFVIELSQYILGNGHPDIDDLILNIVGFYIGVIIKMLLDKVITKSTDGRLTTFFIFNK